MKRIGRRTLGAGAMALAASSAMAQPKPMQIVVGFPPGQQVDIVARILAERFGSVLGRSVIVSNKPGQGGSIALGQVAKAAPDGDTLTLSALAALVANPHLYGNVAYDTLKDFAPIGLVYDAPLLLVAHPGQPFNSVAELVAFAKANPGKLTHPSSGNGTVSHLGMVDFLRRAGIKVEHVPYQGSAPAMVDLMEGRVQIGMDTVAVTQAHIKSGKLKLLASCTSKRLAQYPDTPTVAELGYPGFEAVAWIGLLAPAGTPKELIATLNRELNAAINTPSFAERLAAAGTLPRTSTPEEFAAYLKAEFAKWAELVKLSGAKVD